MGVVDRVSAILKLFGRVMGQFLPESMYQEPLNTWIGKLCKTKWLLEPSSLVLGREGSPPIISTKGAAWVILAVHPPYIRPESRRYGSIERGPRIM
jgi:hypothetical protein